MATESGTSPCAGSSNRMLYVPSSMRPIAISVSVWGSLHFDLRSCGGGHQTTRWSADTRPDDQHGDTFSVWAELPLVALGDTRKIREYILHGCKEYDTN